MMEKARINRDDFPMLMCAADIQAIGLSRPTAYQLLNREDLPVVTLGRRRYMNRDRFFAWLDEQTAGTEQPAPRSDWAAKAKLHAATADHAAAGGRMVL